MDSRGKKQRIAWITGASSGIGLETARELAASGGWRLGLGARRFEKLREVVNDLPGSGGPHACARLDVCDAVSVRAWADALRERLGGEPDLVVHCAGWGVFRKIVDTTEEEWDRTISTNVKGLFLVTREVLPAMLGRGSGHFVNVLSVTAKVAFPKNSAYCASKYGALGFTEALRAETRRHGIRVTAVFPGATDTPFWDRLEGEWDRTKMMPAAAVARAIREAAEAGPNAMVEEIHIGPQQGNL